MSTVHLRTVQPNFKLITFAIILKYKEIYIYIAVLFRIIWPGVGYQRDILAPCNERQMLRSHNDNWKMKGHIWGEFSFLLYR